MDSRERLQRLMAGEAADRCGFWLGNPHADTWPIYHRYFGTTTPEELRVRLGDDFRWFCPQFEPGVYQAPDRSSLWGPFVERSPGGAPPLLAQCETPEEVYRLPWPNPDYLNFDSTLAALRAAGPYYRAGGFWTCFFHELMDFFGMETYFIRMYTHPEVVQAATECMGRFYYTANVRFFEAAGRDMDAFFFGNDFGTQLDVMVSPEAFDTFILPWFRRFTDLGHQFGYRVILHSCGAIRKVIGRLIEAGVDALHPLQARAAGMEAERLSREFGGRLCWIGGVDTQELLVRGTPDQIREEVRRLRPLFGPRWIVSPSHEALLPNVPPENVLAMAEAARELA